MVPPSGGTAVAINHSGTSAYGSPSPVAVSLAPQLTVAPEAFEIPLWALPSSIDPQQRFADKQLEYEFRFALNTTLGGVSLTNRSALRFAAHAHYAAFHTPRIGASFGAMELLAAGAHKIGIDNPAAHFATVVAGVHLAQPFLDTAMDGAYSAIHRLLDGGVAANTDAVAKQTVTALAEETVPKAAIAWGQSLRQFAAKATDIAGTTMEAIGKAPFHMGRGLMWSKFWESAYRYFADDGSTSDNAMNTGAERAMLYGFFTEEIMGVMSRGAIGRLLEGAGFAGSVARAVNIAFAIPMAADLLTMAKYSCMGDEGSAWMVQNHRIGEARYGGSGVWGLLRVSNMGKTVIDDTVAGHSIFTPLADAEDWLGQHLTGHLKTEHTGSYIRDLVARQDGVSARELVTQFRNAVWRLLITPNADPGSFDSLAEAYRMGFLDRVNTLPFLVSYDKTVDGAQSFYTITRAFQMFMQYPAVRAVADFFNEDFRTLPFGHKDLVNGMPVLTPEGWDQLRENLGGDQTILAEREVNFFKQALAIEIDAAVADTTSTTDPSALAMQKATTATYQQWISLAREIHRTDDHGALKANESYYRALGSLSVKIVSSGNPGALSALRTWADQRLAQLKRSDLPLDVRQRLLTELKLINPYVVFGRDSKEVAEFTSLSEHRATQGNGLKPVVSIARQGFFSRVTPMQPDFDTTARTAFQETAQSWLEQAAHSLTLDIQSQTALPGGAAYSYEALASAATATVTALHNQQRVQTLRERVAHLERVEESPEAVHAYDWGKPGCARLPETPCDGSQRVLRSDLFDAQQALAQAETSNQPNPSLRDAMTFLQYAADAQRLAPINLGLPEGLDRISGQPTDAAAVMRLVQPRLEANTRAEAEIALKAAKPGYYYPDPLSPYRTEKLKAYEETAQQIGRSVARWYVDAIVQGLDPMTTIQERLQSPEGLEIRRHMQKQVIRLQLAPGMFADGYTAATLFDGHGQIKDTATFLQWIQKDASFVYQETADRLGNALGDLYMKAVAEEKLTEPDAMWKAMTRQRGNFPGLQSFLETSLNTEERQKIAALIRTLHTLESTAGRHPHHGHFHVDDEGAISVANMDDLGLWLTMGGMRPGQDANAPSYIEGALRKWHTTAQGLVAAMRQQYAVASKADQTTLLPHLRNAVALELRLSAMMTVRAEREKQYDANTHTLEKQFLQWWSETPSVGLGAKALRWTHIAARLSEPNAAPIRALIRQQRQLQHDYRLEGKAADRIYTAEGGIADWDRFEAWIEGTGKTPKPPVVTTPYDPRDDSLLYNRF